MSYILLIGLDITMVLLFFYDLCDCDRERFGVVKLFTWNPCTSLRKLGNTLYVFMMIRAVFVLVSTFLLRILRFAQGIRKAQYIALLFTVCS